MSFHVIEIRPHDSGGWTVRVGDAADAITIHSSKGEAIEFARSIGATSPAAELVVLRRDGTVEERVACWPPYATILS